MTILRSEPMQHGTLVIPVDRGADIVEKIGTAGVLQIQDMNVITMRRPYKRYIQRIEEVERMLRYLTEEIIKLPGATIVSGNVENFLEHDKEYRMENVEDSVSTLYQQFVKFRENNDDLLKQRNHAIMEKAVAKTAADSLQAERGLNSSARNLEHAASQALLQTTADPEAGAAGYLAISGFSNFAGVVLQEDQEKLARTLFRAARGNAYTHVEALEEETLDDNGNPVMRSVFVVYYQGGPGSALHEKITRICQAFGVETFDWPKSQGEASRKISELDELILDKSKALEAYEEFFFDEISVLLEVVRPSGNSLIEEWRLFCQKQTALYATLNFFEASDATLRADCWYPVEEEEAVREMLAVTNEPGQVGAFLVNDATKKHASPPTYTKVSEFSEAFQNVVDTYGVPHYQEANPGLLTCVTFPYLFGIMFGDIGHGSLVFFGGLALVTQYEKLKKAGIEMLGMILYGRYMILLMGMFAIYSGFLYNDFFSLGLDIFGSRYQPQAGWVGTANETKYEPVTNKAFPYPFGFDPVWKGAENELTLTNSFKMKYSVIVGGTQMIVGVTLKAFNCVYFKDWLSFGFEFVPQMIFMVCLVGYMDFLIFFKWCNSGKDISIITTIINMCMLTPLTAKMTFYPSQGNVQSILFILMILSVPWMLLPKPIIKSLQWKKAQKKKAAEHPIMADQVALTETGGEEGAMMIEGEDEEDEPFEFGEEFIHQMIETIEFVLGTVSNTASYLRLWALSLAHQQLALVFFEKIMLTVINSTVTVDGNTIVPGIAVFLAFGAFAAITFGILLCMDALECFLHALRLQWVEFQNKFYKADGYKFMPLNYYRLLAKLDDDA